MAHRVLTDARIWVAEYDLAADMNALSCEYVAEAVDDTNFGDDSEVNMGGNRSVAFEASGRYDATNADVALFNKAGAADTLISFARVGTEGEAAYAFNGLVTAYNPKGEQGEAFGYDMSARGDGELVRGTIMLNATKTATGSSTARQLGAVASGESVYAALHVISASGTTPTLDVTVKSDDASGMLSPVTRLTFAQATGATAEFKSAAGPVTDGWWRVDYTIGGTSPSFTFVVIVGIK